MKERRPFSFAIRLEADLGKMHAAATAVGLDWRVIEPADSIDDDEDPAGYVEAGPAADAGCEVKAPELFRMAGMIAENSRPSEWSIWVRGKLGDGSAEVGIPLHSEWHDGRKWDATMLLNASVLASDLAQRIETAKRVLDGADPALPPF